MGAGCAGKQTHASAGLETLAGEGGHVREQADPEEGTPLVEGLTHLGLGAWTPRSSGRPWEGAGGSRGGPGAVPPRRQAAKASSWVSGSVLANGHSLKCPFCM